MLRPPPPFSCIVHDTRKEHSLYEIGIILDPVSPLAQRWAPIIRTLSSLKNVFLRVFLVPTLDVSPSPVKHLYSYSFPPSLEFDDAQDEKKPTVSFEGIPGEAIVSLTIETRRRGKVVPVGDFVVERVSMNSLPVGFEAEFELRREGDASQGVGVGEQSGERVRDEL
jgi:hypothetical protein